MMGTFTYPLEVISADGSRSETKAGSPLAALLQNDMKVNLDVNGMVLDLLSGYL